MHEFSSISVSAYEPAELTKQLNEQTAAGWSVVSIVPTGSTVTAYLSRAAGDAAGSDSSSAAASDSSAASDSAAAVGSDVSADTSAVSSDWGSTPGTAMGSTVIGAVYEADSVSTDTGTVGVSDFTAVTDTGATISEQAAWAGGDAVADVSSATSDLSSSVSDQASSFSDQASSFGDQASSFGDQASQVAQAGAGQVGHYTSGAADAAANVGGAVQHQAHQAGAVVSSEVGAAAASTGTAPPGWYADPAGRFEVRYWDGGQWTEHVATNQVQYTDPPVA